MFSTPFGTATHPPRLVRASILLKAWERQKDAPCRGIEHTKTFKRCVEREEPALDKEAVTWITGEFRDILERVLKVPKYKLKADTSVVIKYFENNIPFLFEDVRDFFNGLPEREKLPEHVRGHFDVFLQETLRKNYLHRAFRNAMVPVRGLFPGLGTIAPEGLITRKPRKKALARSPSQLPGLAGVLSDAEIAERLREAFEEGEGLFIHPRLRDDLQIHCCKVELHLSGVIYEFKGGSIAVYDPVNGPSLDYRRRIILSLGEPYTLHPGNFVLAPTFENIAMPDDLMGILQGRSSAGRLGLIVHATASFIDPGYKGTLTFELSNLGPIPIKLYALAPLGTLVLVRTGKVNKPYGWVGASPAKRGEKTRLGLHDSPISEPSHHGDSWEYEILRKLSKSRNREEPHSP